jgi:peptidoglycan hydrolase-like protein with peptidoglycan-binding domain
MAQSVAWVQVEAQPTLSSAQDRVRAYAAQFENVNGYYLGGGWYGIALGPYAPTDAEALLRQLRGTGQVPGDSFIADGRQYKQQFWPIGVGAETTAQPLPDTLAALAVVPEPETAPETVPGAEATSESPVVPEVIIPEPVVIPDETVREARASEALLTRDEREQLQTALKWAGYYDAAIDGAFGRGTRASMQAWQEANNHDGTGILTTLQRAELLAAYNAVLDGLGMAVIRDVAAGIEIEMPTAVVAFGKYEPPFAQYDATGDLAARVLLISQEGDQDRFFGLYEILQTLAIVPTNGERSRSDRTFDIDGSDTSIHTTIHATLGDGQIKGFALVWPTGDEERRSRVLEVMKASFAPIDGVLDPAIAPPDENQAIDMISGLELRKPRLSRSGYYIDGTGAALTTAEAVADCDYVTLDDADTATVAFRDDALGIAVLRPDTPLAPMGVATFQTGVPRLQSDVAVGGYPYGGVLVTPSVTFGTLADLRGLDGEETIKRLALTAQPGDAGGPVFDSGGAVLGMLLPRAELNGQMLPPDVSFAVETDAILAALSGAGITVGTTDQAAFMPRETLAQIASDMTVLVSCW